MKVLQFSVFLTLYLLVISQLVVAASENDEEIPEQELLKWKPPQDFRSKYPYYLSGLDHEGGQVWIVDIGKWDIRDIADGGGQRLEDFKMYVRQMYTRAAADNKHADQSKGTVVIMDMDGYNLEKATHLRGTLVTLDMLRNFEKFVREGGGYKQGYIVNANFLFETFWRVGKPLLGRVSEVIDVFGTNPAKWRPKLLKTIPADQLPAHLGGEKGHKYIAVYG